MIQAINQCRRCVECEGMSHHWIPNSEFGNETAPEESSGFAYVCKHCGVVGRECHGCYGMGSEDNDNPETSDICGECDGEGVIANDIPDCSAMECPDKRSWWQKQVDRLFPCKHCPLPEAPAEWKDCMTTRTVTKLDWADWLRVIVSGVVCVDIRTVTENEVGGTRTEVALFIGTNRDVRGER